MRIWRLRMCPGRRFLCRTVRAVLLQFHFPLWAHLHTERTVKILKVLVIFLLLAMMTYILYLRHDCDATNCSNHENHPILISTRFSSRQYLQDTEQSLVALFHLPQAHKAKTTNRKQSEYFEQKALRDFRLRAQRVANLCPAIVANQTSEARGGKSIKVWGYKLTMSKAETVKGVFWDKASRTACCFVPKAGCTFWIRVYSFLLNSTGIAVSSPWELPRLALHTKKQNPYAEGSPLWYLQDSVMRDDTLRFMVTRDPYSRLWSAYVDKFLLPDFWRFFGRIIIKRVRPNATENALRCGHDVTFQELIEASFSVENTHWEPIHKRCDPCRYKPQLIADMETFSRDSTLVLRRMGMETVLTQFNRTQQKELELKTLINYNFDLIETVEHYKGCINQSELASLLWKAFQINGYLPEETLYSPEEGKEVSRENFEDSVILAFRESYRMHDALKKQKKKFMEAAFKSLPHSLIDRVRERFRLDFELFGYDDSPFR